MSVRFPVWANKFQTSLGAAKNTTLGWLGKIAVSVDGLEKFSKFSTASLEVFQRLSNNSAIRNNNVINAFKGQFKSYAEFANATYSVGRVYDWTVDYNKHSGWLKRPKLFFLTVGHFLGTARYLGELKLISLGRFAQSTFSWRNFDRLPGIGLMKDIPISISSVFAIADNGRTLHQLARTKKEIIPFEKRKWAAKNELLSAVKKNNQEKLAELRQEYTICRKKLGVELTPAGGKVKQKANDADALNAIAAKWDKLVASAQDQTKDRAKIAKWKLDVWNLKEATIPKERHRAIISIAYDLFKIVLISATVASVYIAPVPALFFVAFGFGASYLGLHKVLLTKAEVLKRPVAKTVFA